MLNLKSNTFQWFHFKSFRIFVWTAVWTVIILFVLENVVLKNLLWSVPRLEKYLLLRPNDDWVHNAFTIQKIKRYARQNDSEKILVYLGGSTSLESITRDRNMEAKLLKGIGEEVKFVSITSSYMTYAEETMIISELQLNNATYIISIGPQYLTKVSQTQILHDEHTYLRYFYLPVPTSVRNLLSEYGLDLGLFYTFRIFRSAFAIAHQIKYNINNKVYSTEYDRHYAPDKSPVRETPELKNNLEKWHRQSDRFGEMNFKLLKLAVDAARKNNNKVIFIRMPHAPLFKEESIAYEALLDKHLLPFLEKEYVDYIDLSNKTLWEQIDFSEYTHLGETGRKKFEDVLSSELKAYFKDNGKGQ
jgi:hypothetical protein